MHSFLADLPHKKRSCYLQFTPTFLRKAYLRQTCDAILDENFGSSSLSIAVRSVDPWQWKSHVAPPRLKL